MSVHIALALYAALLIVAITLGCLPAFRREHQRRSFDRHADRALDVTRGAKR